MRYFTILFILCLSFVLCAKDISIVSNGKSDYAIVVDKNASEIDKFAARELQSFIEKMSKVKLPVAESANGKKIVIGPAANIHQDENVIDIKDGNIRLYGGGIHGNLFAVYELLENHFGIMFLNAYGDCHIPAVTELTVKEGKTSVRYAFPKRGMMNFFYSDRTGASIYMYRNRCNILLDSFKAPRNPGKEKGVINYEDDFLQAHSFSRLIPPGIKNRNSYIQNAALDFVRDKKYFISNPEWFSMDESGKRVPDRQLCFTNTELKKELEKNIQIYFNNLKNKSGLNGIIELSANDIYNRICCCKPCVALDNEYGANGVAMLLAICEIAERNPQIPFRAMAYQRGQSLIPPAKTVKWPKNLGLIFAPINGDFANPLTSKENTIELNALKNWCKYTKNILFWYYPNPYNRQRDKYFELPPTFMTDRLAADYKLMRDLGIAGFYTEHDSGGILSGTNFSELQTYIMFKLMQNPDCDTDKLTRKFINVYYGKAAPFVQKYHDIIAKEMRAFTQKGGIWHYNTADYPFLTQKVLNKIDKLLNQAEKAVDGDFAFRVRALRLGFDSTYVALVNTDHKERLKKMEATLIELIAKRKVRTSLKNFHNWKKEIYAAASAKKLPPELANIAPEYILDYFAPSSGVSIVKDPDANLGRAFVENWTHEKPFRLGTYDSATKKYGAGLGITPNMIKGKGYHFYTFSRTIKLTAPTILFGGSWRLNFRIGSKVFHDDAAAAEKEYIVHVSLKFEKDRVFCDRVILQEKVKFPPKILPENLKKLPSSDVIVIESDANAKNSVFCSDGSCGRALFEKIDTKKAAYNFGIYHQKTKNYGSSSIGINYKTAKKNEFKLYTLPRPGILHSDSILFGGRWHIIFPIGKAVAAQGVDALKKKWQINVSLKISDSNEAYVDRVILVAQP
ncbi:MAG: DUF4838 domain-containing protein [Lentisphaeria bacterium]|nr:DUF4838 domain-containing protein [Lentisphaeria bacterium]